MSQPARNHQVGTPTLQNKFACPICQDKEFVFVIINGQESAAYCECRKQKQIERRIKSSMMDKQFKGCTFTNYRPQPHTIKMFTTAKDYGHNFEAIRKERHNGFGFMAVMGETALRQIKDPVERTEKKAEHNSYGLGKTHLQAAVTNHLLRLGVQVIMANDSDIVAELRAGQFAEDGEHFERIIQALEAAELLIWDDLGKAKTTEWVLNQYYRIFNFRYRNGLPTCFSTNEDMDTLAERIGDATASRLYAMCRGRLVACEGPDYRLK